MFFQVDDQLPSNAKTRRLVEPVLDGDIAGLAALGVWTLTGASSNVMGGGTDGFVSRADLVRAVLDPRIADRLAALLVEVGFWHAPGHTCDRCPPVPQGKWLFHDWFDMKYTPAAQAQINKAKRKELQDAKLVAQVWARDCIDPADTTVGACRYCGVTVRRKDTRSTNRPHLDHVDPRKAAGIRNVVLACGQCNQKKGNRSPQEAGMTLLQPPAHSRPPQQMSVGAGSSSPSRPYAGPSESGSSRPGEHAGLDHSDAYAGPPTPGSSRPGVHAATDHCSRPTADHNRTGPPPDHDVDHTVDHADTTLVPPGNQPGFAVPGGRGPGQGQGQGMGEGVGEGDRSGSPQPDHLTATSSRKSRRRKRRSRTPTRGEPPSPELSSESLDAGNPPPGVQAPAGGFGSPWHGWRGQRSPVDETHCPIHHLPDPCWRCGREQENQ